MNATQRMTLAQPVLTNAEANGGGEDNKEKTAKAATEQWKSENKKGAKSQNKKGAK